MNLSTFSTFASRTVALEQRDELTLLRVSNAHADALIALQGAQVLEFCAKGQRPLLWLSELAEFKRGQSVRGGIPVCWPWFGDIQRNPEPVQQMTHGENLPAHGFVRNRNWTLDAIVETAEHTQITLSYTTWTATQSEWPHNASVRLTISIGQTLRLQLTTRNDSPAPLTLTQALHTYFPVSDIQQVAINGLGQTRYIDTLDAWREQAQSGGLDFSGETDRIYLDVPTSIELVDRGWQRRIALRAHNSRSAIVWNPWIEKSKRLSQFADDAWQRMLCIETANVLSDSVTLAPGAEHTLAVELAG
jgi:glucose-6-phosphate 1-epimerase